jgi:ribonuclease P protein component
MHSLSKAEILRGDKQIEVIFKTGKRMHAAPLMLVVRLTETEEDQPVKAAFIVPKKKFKKATERNRIRRQMREAYRLNKQPLKELLKLKKKTLQLLFIYTGKSPCPFAEIQQKIVLLLQRLMLEHA